jgi:glycosyltransferase involved in cell wall biosynthesis
MAQYANACALLRKAQCNAVLLLNGQSMRTAIVQELLRLSPRNVLWTTEDPFELPTNLRRAAGFDYVFTNDRGSLADYAGKAHYMPLAARVSGEPVPMERRYRDVFFAGVAWPNRVKFFRDLIPRLDGLKIQFLLPYDAHLSKPSLPIPECEWNVRLGFADLLTAARYSKVAIYLGRNFSTCGYHGRIPSPGKRLFETAALGVAQVAISDEATIGHYFEPGKEILLARSAEEAAGMIRELLADLARLEALGQAARKRVLAEHLYTHRARAILDRMADMPVRRPSKTKPQPLRLLMVAHGVRGQRPWGGTELHVDQLRKSLKHKYDIHLLYTSECGSGRSMVYRHPGSGRQRVLYSGPYNAFRSWTDPQRDAAFQKLLVEEKIHLVHFVHFLFHSFGYVEVARSLGRPTVLGLYDFFIVCPQFNLLNSSGRFCNLPAIEMCDQCLAHMDGLPAGAQSRRRELLSQVCSAVDKIHFLCHSQRSLIERVLPIPEDKVFVQGLGIRPEISPQAPRAAWSPPLPAPPLRIAVLGNHAHNKGADTLISIVQRLASESFQFRIAGAVEEPYKTRLEAMSRNSIELLGSYEPEQVGAILRGCHVALFASPWPETFMLTLSEAIHAGAVPVGPTLGAFGERVRDGENGLVVRGDVGSYVRALLTLLDNPSLLERLKAGVSATHVLTLEEDAAGFEQLYDGLAAEYGLAGASFPVSLESEEMVTTPAGHNPAAKSTLEKAMWIYKTQGAHAVFHRAWQRTSAWIRSI